MKEYKFEYTDVDISQLEANLMDEKTYREAHKGLVILCHDVFVQYDSGILLVKRLVAPAKNIVWCLGGRVKRGVSVENSLRERIRDEANLELEDLTELNYVRTYFQTDPFGHKKGTDSLNLVYFAKGQGKLKLDNSHTEPIIITPEQYKLSRNQFHPYVVDFMDIIYQI